MCNFPWPQPKWSELASSRHRDRGAAAKKAWDRSFYAADTRNRKSKYTPYLSRNEIEQIEMECVQNAQMRTGEWSDEVRCEALFS